jgi:hypothetical protein
MPYLPMTNLHPPTSNPEEEEYQPLPYENFDLSGYQFGMETFNLYCPVSYSECCRLFSAMCEADNGPDNRPLARTVPQDFSNTGFGE